MAIPEFCLSFRDVKAMPIMGLGLGVPDLTP